MNQKSKLEQKKKNVLGSYASFGVMVFVAIALSSVAYWYIFRLSELTLENKEAHGLFVALMTTFVLIYIPMYFLGRIFLINNIDELVKTNTDFWADTATETLDKVVKAVDAQLKKQMSDSARAKFDGEVAQITAVMASTIPDKLVELLTKVANYERKDGLPKTEHGQMSALTTFFYTTKNKLDVIAATEQLAMQDIDDELSDIIDDWGKLKKEWNM